MQERYCGIVFSIRENGVGKYLWEIRTPDGLPAPKSGVSGTVVGGQNEAILAARKAIGIYLNESARSKPPIAVVSPKPTDGSK